MKRPSWMYRQSAALPFRFVDGELQIMLISNTDGSRWVIPKGIVDRNLKSSESAAKEAFEEAGVRGRVLKPALGRYRTKKWDGKCRIKVFLLLTEEILQRWPEESYRKRVWIRPEEAGKYLKKKKLVKLIGKIPQFIENHAECPEIK